jgi:hypothetical protein
MKWIAMFAITLLLSACGCRYNGINTRDVLVSTPGNLVAFEPNDDAIDVTDEHITYTR